MVVEVVFTRPEEEGQILDFESMQRIAYYGKLDFRIAFMPSFVSSRKGQGKGRLRLGERGSRST